MRKHTRLSIVVASVAASGLLVAAGSTMVAAKTVSPLTVAFDYGSPLLLDNFNPFATDNLSGYKYMFEPLYIVDDLNGKETPALATSYKWVNTKRLVFTMRAGVKWSNGQPLTAQDVAFTFNLLKKYPALDLNGLWPTLSSVTAKGDQVTFDFSKADVPDWFYIATTPILPESQWSKVANPVKFTDSKPVVSGPFELSTFSGSGYNLTPNPNFWDRSSVKIPEIHFMDLTSNTSTDLLLSEGKIDWATIFTPGIEKTYIARNPKDYHYWFPSGSAQVLYLNLDKAPFNQVKFRQALAYAINRPDIALHGEYGYPKVANQAIVPPGIQKGLVSHTLATQYAYSYSPKKALHLLAQLGYHKNAAGVLLNPKGKPVQFTIIGPSAYTDMIQDEEIITQDLKTIGITVTEISTSVATWTNDYETGHYEMAEGFTDTYPNPWLTYNALLNSDESAPIGQVAPSNYERWDNATTDAALNAYAATTNPTVQHRLMTQIETTLFKDVPVISLFYGPVWYEYQTNSYTGWPTPSNPYADPSNAYPDSLLMVTRVHPIS